MIFPKPLTTNNVNDVDESSRTDIYFIQNPAYPGRNKENSNSYQHLTPIDNENVEETNQPTINCKMERKVIHKQMWNALLIKNNQKDDKGPDMGEKSSELRDGLKVKRTKEHQTMALSCKSRDIIAEDHIAMTSTVGKTCTCIKP